MYFDNEVRHVHYIIYLCSLPDLRDLLAREMRSFFLQNLTLFVPCINQFYKQTNKMHFLYVFILQSFLQH